MEQAKLSLREFSSILRAPGEGLLTISTGSASARERLQPYFGKAAFEKWKDEIHARLQKLKKSGPSTPFQIIGVPSDCGGGVCRGAAYGPLYLREALYRAHPEYSLGDLGDVPCIPHLLHDSMLSAHQLKASGFALWGHKRSGYPVAPLNLLQDYLTALWDELPGFRPLVLGGDHSVSGAVFEALELQGLIEELAVLHFDAHTDLMDERFGVEHCFATWTAHAVRKFKDPTRWVQVGIRASRHDKKYWEKRFGLRQDWARDLLRTDPKNYAETLVQRWRSQGCRYLYISNDIDATDSAWAKATGTPETRGLHPEWIKKVISHCSSALPLVGADLVEVAPVLGAPAEARRTVRTALSYLRALRWI